MNLNRMIDHTMLKADATKETIIRYCREAKEHEFASVCVNTCFVPLVADELKGSEVKTCCVVGFPFSSRLPPQKSNWKRRLEIKGRLARNIYLSLKKMKTRPSASVSALSRGGCAFRLRAR